MVIFCFSVQPDFFFLASFLQGWEYTSVWELMPWFTAQLHETQTAGPGCLLIHLGSSASLPFAPDTVTLGSEHMGKDFLHSHLWPIYKIYCTSLEKCSICEPHERSMDLWLEKNIPRLAMKHWFPCHILLLGFEWGVLALDATRWTNVWIPWNKRLREISFRDLSVSLFGIRRHHFVLLCSLKPETQVYSTHNDTGCRTVMTLLQHLKTLSLGEMNFPKWIYFKN